MLIRPHTLSIITTHQCTAACDHCCFNCTPKVAVSIPVDRMHKLIDEARAIESIRVVVFTGGECFLLGDSLYDLISHCKRNGFITRCVTNGYWATEKNTRKIVSKLSEAGLDEINFSTGEEHGTYVPSDRVRRGALACNQQGIKALVNIELFNDSSFDVDEFLDEEIFRQAIESSQITIQRNVWITGDGARSIAHQKAHSRFNSDRVGGCHTALSVVAVTPRQSLVACCGLHMERIPELHLGSIEEKTLSEVLEAAPDDFLKIWIHVQGPERVLEFVKSKVPDYRLPVESVHPCTTCLHLYKDELARRIIFEQYTEVEEHISNLFLAGLSTSELGRKIDFSSGST